MLNFCNLIVNIIISILKKIFYKKLYIKIGLIIKKKNYVKYKFI